jgi:hypothetical protein
VLPPPIQYLSVGFVALGLICTAIIAIDVSRHPQHMWVMDAVWPLVALFGTVVVVWQYFTYGRLATSAEANRARQLKTEPLNERLTPFPVMVANGTLHCGSGCALGDLCAEWLAFAIPGVAIAFGWHSLFQLFRHVLATRLETNSFDFWFMMQIAMCCGFVTSYPANWWLLRVGIKEKM